MYLIDAIGRASEDKARRPASAFYYGSAIEHGIDWTHFGSITLIALALVLLAALAFRRRDALHVIPATLSGGNRLQSGFRLIEQGL